MSVKYTREPGCFRDSGLTHHVVGMPNSSGPSTRQTRLTRRRVESSSINLDQIPFGLRAAACLRATPPHVTRVCAQLLHRHAFLLQCLLEDETMAKARPDSA